MKNNSTGKSGIYAIKNLINNKMYIGSTSDFKSRCRSHRTLLNRNKHFNKHLQNSVNKYGLSNFEFIPYDLRLKLLNNSNNRQGQVKIVEQLDKNGNHIRFCNTISDAAKYLGYKKSTPIRQAIIANKLIKNYYFKYIEPYCSDIIGKPEELLENPAEDNQQPSLELTIKKGSETNSII